MLKSGTQFSRSIQGSAVLQLSVVPALPLKMSAPVSIFLPQIYVVNWQPLQSHHVQDRELVPCQTQSLHAFQSLQERRYAAEGVEGQAEVGQTLQRAQLHGQSGQWVTVQEKSLQTGHEREKEELTDTNHSTIQYIAIYCSTIGMMIYWVLF